MDSFEILRSCSLDRDDLVCFKINTYPNEYGDLQKTIEQVFHKSEILLKCQLKFEQLVKMHFAAAATESEKLDNQLDLIITGTVKSGKSSFLNVLLNSKISPPGIVGSSICIEFSHPRNQSKSISIGVLDWNGWEIAKYTDLSIIELPQKIEEIQKTLGASSSFSPAKKQSLKKRIKVQLPHWFLKNTNIYKCASIDGIYSFDEPFDIIDQSQNAVLIHVIDASNGIMEWDRTFLSRLLYKKPNLPIFFVINRVDIEQEIFRRDNVIRFEMSLDRLSTSNVAHCTPNTSSNNLLSNLTTESESDCASVECFSESSIAAKQESLIARATNHIKKLGFPIDNQASVCCAPFSSKHFLQYLTDEKYSTDCIESIREINYRFFECFRKFLIQWYWKLLVTNLLKLKSRVDGIIESILCDIRSMPNSTDQEIISSLFFKEMTKRERLVMEHFQKTNEEIERQVLKCVRDQIRNHENEIEIKRDQIQSDDIFKVFTMMRPSIHKSIENILLPISSTYNDDDDILPSQATSSNAKQDTLTQDLSTLNSTFSLNNEIIRIITDNITKLDKSLKDLSKHLFAGNFRSHYLRDIYRLFVVLKNTIVYPQIINIPHDMLTCDQLRLNEYVNQLKRKVFRNMLQSSDILKFAINNLNISPLIETTLKSISNILSMIQQFSSMYQKTYKIARNYRLINLQNVHELIICDYLLEVSSQSFSESNRELIDYNFTRINTFQSDFFTSDTSPMEMFMKCSSNSFINLQRFSQSLWLRRILSGKNRRILLPRTIQLIRNDQCLFSYTKLSYDLYTRIRQRPKWKDEQIGYIILQLVDIARVLQPYESILPMKMTLSNILLHEDNEVYTCFYHPFDCGPTKCQESNSEYSNKYNDIDDLEVKHRESLLYQIGVILLNLLLKDSSCRYLLPRPEDYPYSPQTLQNFCRGIEEKVCAASNTLSPEQHNEGNGPYSMILEVNKQSKNELVKICERVLIQIEGKDPIVNLDGFSKELEKYRKKSGR